MVTDIDLYFQLLYDTEMDMLIPGEALPAVAEFHTAATEIAEHLLTDVLEIEGVAKVGLAGITQPESGRINTSLFISRQRQLGETTYSFGDEINGIRAGVTWGSDSPDVKSFFRNASSLSTEATQAKILQELESSVPFNPETHLVVKVFGGNDRIVRRNLITRLGKFLGF